MKKLLYLFAVLALLASCSDNDEGSVTGLQLDKSELTVAADGAQEVLQVAAPDRWYASVDAPWITVSPATGFGSQQCTVQIDSTLIRDVRTATVRFTADNGDRRELTVRQTGYGNIIHADSTLLHVAASQRSRDDRYVDLTVTTNVAFDVDVRVPEGSPQWLTPQMTEVTLDRGARPRTTKLRFRWTNNAFPTQREAEISLTPRLSTPADTSEPMLQADAAPTVVRIIQAPAPLITDTREGDSLALVAMAEALDVYNAWPTSEKLDNWGDVRLWEKSDTGLPCPEAVGRVRDVRFMMVNVADGESLPAEVRHLKYLESLSYYSNVNSFLKTIHLGTEVCTLKHLRSLEVFAMGLADLPQELTQLSGTLECLRIACNNFNAVPAVLTKENFPKLRILEMHANRRWTTSDLRNRNDSRFEGGLGLYFHTGTNDALRRLLLWDTLEELVLSYNYIEGQVPDFKVGEDGVEAWSQADVDAWGGDTIQWLADHQMPKILPKAKRLTLNLNFFTGPMPDWLLYHPLLMEWNPDILIFNQMENGRNSDGLPVRFSNEPSNFEYYFEAFPLYRGKYEIKEEWSEEEAARVAKYSTELLNQKR